MSQGEPSTSQQATEVPKFKPIQSSGIRGTIYIKYRSDLFTHMSDRMASIDAVSRVVYLAGSKGSDRVSVAARLGYNGQTKGGSRKISDYLQNITRGLPNEAGTCHKLNGKFRVHSFFHKAHSLSAFKELLDNISQEIGRPCPFKEGDQVSFPGTKLSRMKITDIALKRILLILQCIKADHASLIRDVHKKLIETETAAGSEFMMDKKTLLKLCTFLEMKKLARIHNVTVVEDDSQNKCTLQVISTLDVLETSDPRITAAILRAQKEYHSQGKVFPSGHNRAKNEPPKKKTPKAVKKAEALEEMDTTEVPEAKDGTSPYYQRKMIRLHLFHEYVHYFVHGQADRQDVPNYFKRFASAEQAEVYNAPAFDEMLVYDDSPNSLFRFVPPYPSLDDKPRGWFMLRHLLRSMPLSVFALIFDSHIDDKLSDYLNDPIKRHILLFDLPADIRKQCMHKRTVGAASLLLLQLCGMGLLLAAPEVQTSYGSFSLFYVKNEATIYDTSPAAKSYAIVTEPAESFEPYKYEFKTFKDIYKFWYHFRAIALSTALNVRLKKNDDDPDMANLARRFSKESYLKVPFLAPSYDCVDYVAPSLPGKGACLVDAALFVHLKRHWDLVNVGKPYVDWFMARYKEHGEAVRIYVEARVQRLNKFWISVMQFLVTNKSFELFKRQNNKRKVTFDDSALPEKKKKVVTFKVGSRKRGLDEEDMESANKSQYLRSRFSYRERDMMVLLRAVSQFLNPVEKTWVDPVVMRRIMKAYLEESNYKTIVCLMAASIREMQLPHRQADIWHLVRGLGSFSQMRRIRDQLASIMNADFEVKAEYFCKAFDIAYRLVTQDIPRLPSVLINDDVFYKILNRNNLTLGSSSTMSTVNPAYEEMTKMPTSKEERDAGLMFEWVLNAMLNEDVPGINDIPPAVIAQQGSDAFYQRVDRMYSSGMIVRTREVGLNNKAFNHQVALSSSFFLYFNHNYRPDVLDAIEALPDLTHNEMALYSDNVAVFLRLIYALTDPNAVFTAVVDLSAFPAHTKKRSLRLTESAAIKLNHIAIGVDSSYLKRPMLDQTLSKCIEETSSFDVDKLDFYRSPEHLNTVCDALVDNGRMATDAIVKRVLEAGADGVLVSDLKELACSHDLSEKDASDLLIYLADQLILFGCGMDARRYVHISSALDWALRLEKRAMFVKPWTNPDGSTNLSTFRWMVEMVFISILESPMITTEKIKEFFCGVVHGVVVDEIVDFLLRCKLIYTRTDECVSRTVLNPFSRTQSTELVTSLWPRFNALELFAVLFQGVKVSDNLRLRQQQQSDHEGEEHDGTLQGTQCEA